MWSIIRAYAVLAIAIMLPTVATLAADPHAAERACQVNRPVAIWQPSDAILVARIASSFGADIEGCARELIFEDAADPKKTGVLLNHGLVETPYALVPLGERFVSIWVSGSAFLTIVHAFENGKIREVLSVRSKGLPEITYAKDGSEVLVFTTTASDAGKFDVYRWSGSTYSKRIGVSRARRLSE